MKKLKKLSIKKITVSNLSEEAARQIHGGDIGTAGAACTQGSCVNGPCTNDCHTNACASNTDDPNCTRVAGGCTAGQTCPSNNNTCFTQLDCTYGNCTDVNNGCVATYMDATCKDYTCQQ
jgi:hypothetical protein